MATRKEVSDTLARMAPGEDILIIKTSATEFDIVKLSWIDVPGRKLKTDVEVGK